MAAPIIDLRGVLGAGVAAALGVPPALPPGAPGPDDAAGDGPPDDRAGVGHPPGQEHGRPAIAEAEGPDLPVRPDPLLDPAAQAEDQGVGDEVPPRVVGGDLRVDPPRYAEPEPPWVDGEGSRVDRQGFDERPGVGDAGSGTGQGAPPTPPRRPPYMPSEDVLESLIHHGYAYEFLKYATVPLDAITKLLEKGGFAEDEHYTVVASATATKLKNS